MFLPSRLRLSRLPPATCVAFFVAAVLAGCGGGTTLSASSPSYTAFNFVYAIGKIPYSLGSITAGPEGALWIASTQVWRLRP